MPVESLAQFNKSIDDFARKIPGKVSALQKKIVLEALKRIVERTPVDTGRARGNWQVTIGTPARGVVEDSDKLIPPPKPSATLEDQCRTLTSPLPPIEQLEPQQ